MHARTHARTHTHTHTHTQLELEQLYNNNPRQFWASPLREAFTKIYRFFIHKLFLLPVNKITNE